MKKGKFTICLLAIIFCANASADVMLQSYGQQIGVGDIYDVGSLADNPPKPGAYCIEDAQYGLWDPAAKNESCFGASYQYEAMIGLYARCEGGETVNIGTKTHEINILCDGEFHSLYSDDAQLALGPQLSLLSPYGESISSFVFGVEDDSTLVSLPIDEIDMRYQINSCKKTYHLVRAEDKAHFVSKEDLGKIYSCVGPAATEFTEISLPSTT